METELFPKSVVSQAENVWGAFEGPDLKEN